MIQLSETTFIAKGKLRSTHEYPGNDSLCIKICNDSPVAIHRQKREVKFYKKMEKRKISFEYIAPYVGEVQTNLGTGYIYQRVINPDGSIPCDLNELLRSSDEGNQEILQQIQQLGLFLKKHSIFFHDALLCNILCRKEANGKYSLILIDALGDTVAIPIFNYIKKNADKRITKKWYKYLVRPAIKRFSWINEKNLSIH